MSNSEISLADELENGDYTIEVKETLRRGKKLALNKPGERTLSKEENEQLREYIGKYEGLIKEIYEVGSEKEGFDRAWELGRLMVEASQEADQEGEDFSFNDLTPAISAFNFSSSTAYRCRLLYRMFPGGQYEENVLPHTTTAEIMQAADNPEEARKVYYRIRDSDVDPKESHVRAWGASKSNLESIASAVNDKCEDNLVENTIKVCKLHGLESEPTEEEIEQILRS